MKIKYDNSGLFGISGEVCMILAIYRFRCIKRPTWISKPVNYYLVQSHRRLYDFNLITAALGHWLCDEKQVGEQETVDVHLKIISRMPTDDTCITHNRLNHPSKMYLIRIHFYT